MKLKQFIVSFGLGLGLAGIFLAGMANAGGPDHHKGSSLLSTISSLSAAESGSVQETDLTPGGEIYEVNPDALGNLWLSEYGAGQVWQLNRSTSVYTIYNGLDGASDARRDNNNNVWWTDYDNGFLGRIDLTTSTVTMWPLPGVGSPWGVAIDASGQIWVTDADNNTDPHIYRFNLTSTQVCSYTMPDGGQSDYIVYDAGDLWMGDWENGRLVKFNSVTNQFTYWQLPFDSYPEGLAVDSSSNLWWAENNFPALGRLEPSANRITTYTLPIGESVNMITISSGGSIWYTEGSLTSTFGVMDPNTAVGNSTTITTATVVATSSCTILGPGITFTPVISTGVAAFTTGVVTPTVNSDGWTVYQPASGSSLWGIANTGGVWIGDQERDKLIWFSFSTYLPILFK